ncbi:MAG: LruC domain-containing protein [Bacteroidota bacterium]
MKKLKQSLLFSWLFLLLLSGGLLMQTACKKQMSNGNSNPTKFTELQVDQNFKFSSYTDVNVTVNVEQTTAFTMFVIQLFNGDPASGGKLIGTGATDANFQYKTKIRMPSSVKQIYIGKISPDGINKYIAANISGTSVMYTFTNGTKSAENENTVPDCNSGCTQTLATGTTNNLTIGAGAIVCVPAGRTVTLNTPTLNAGGTIRICGTVHWNNINGSGGTILLTSTGNMDGNYSLTGRTLNNYSLTYNLPNNNFDGTLNNFGTLDVLSGGTFQINSSAAVHNYGTLNIPSKFNVNGILTNDGPMTIGGDLTNNGSGVITNSCSITITGANSAFANNGALTNNGYVSVCNGTFSAQGGSTTTLGTGALIRCNTFDLEGTVTGPASQGSQIKALSSESRSKTTGGCSVTGYVDLCTSRSISPNGGSYGAHVSFCAYTLPIPGCNAAVAPVITSALTANAYTGSQVTYNITASGTAPITYNATGLPTGLFFSGSTISGNPSVVGIYNVTLTATNAIGFDTQILVITVALPPSAPVITSSLTASGTVNQAFSYLITATGTSPITYNATSLPAGLSFSGSTISGLPATAGTFNVNLTATNAVGSDAKVLVITIASPPPLDTDGDGVPDNLDAYPLDPTRAFNSYYPNESDYGTVAFEDLWPAYGDYDMNDLVMNFNYKVVTNAENKTVDIIVRYKIKAAGAQMNNGFGIILNTAPSNVESVTGCIKVGSAVTIDPKGYEAGHTNETVIIPVDAINTLLGANIVNTVHGGNTIETVEQTVTVHFSAPQANIGDAPFNPFIFVNQERGKEIHLKDQPPSELVNPVYFDTWYDASNVAQGKYYRSVSGLCWAIEIPIDWSYPQEMVDILQTYLHFADWAQSNGTTYQDWYVLQPGYQNASNLY